MQMSPQGAFAMNTTTVDAIADDIKVLLKTNHGERPMQYYYGANLRALLFNPSPNLKQQISDSITTAIDKWMPYVVVNNIQILLTEDDATVDYNSAVINIAFSIGTTGLDGAVTITT